MLIDRTILFMVVIYILVETKLFQCDTLKSDVMSFFTTFCYFSINILNKFSFFLQFLSYSFRVALFMISVGSRILSPVVNVLPRRRAHAYPSLKQYLLDFLTSIL